MMQVVGEISKSLMSWALLGSLAAFAGCGAVPQNDSTLKFDAAHSIALDGQISNGRLLTTEVDDLAVKDLIDEQLYYTVGILNGYHGVADLNRTPRDLITIDERKPLENGVFEIRYSAKLFVAWPREQYIPTSISLVAPANMDGGLRTFFNLYNVKECVDPSAHEVSLGVFWYYYRPYQSQCALADVRRDDSELVSRFDMAFSVSNENTAGKSPEYEKVWEDGRLVVTAVFGKGDSGARTLSDPGVSAYNSMYLQLLREFGRPIESSVQVPPQGPGAEISDVKLRFRHYMGEIDVHLFLVDGIQTVGAGFNTKYNAQTAKSDFVSYSGHSGLGANIRALARKGSFTPGQYQIYMVNGCDTFAYVDYMLRDKHALANPDFGPDKFFDIITNAMPSYFHMNSHSNMTVIRALLQKSATYNQMLSSFDRNQRAVVTGEQDNAWPAPF